MRRLSSVIGSTAFLLLAPGTVAGLVPWWIAGWRLAPPSGPMNCSDVPGSRSGEPVGGGFHGTMIGP